VNLVFGQDTVLEEVPSIIGKSMVGRFSVKIMGALALSRWLEQN
jgi:hypothetical protein